ncbi:MAG: hypothetical protein R6V16_02150, partial [Bacteroidales bacterium]
MFKIGNIKFCFLSGILVLFLLTFCSDNDVESGNDSDPPPLPFNYDIPPSLNFDADNLTNAEEEEYGTNPRHHDTDGDGVNDCVEIRIGTDPLEAEDTDDDGLFDDFERWIIHAAADDPSTDHISSLADVVPDDDFDGDGRTNAQEQEFGTNPTYSEPNILFVYP